MQPNRFQDAERIQKNEPIPKSRTLVAYRTPNTCKGTQLMKKGRGDPYQPGEPR